MEEIKNKGKEFRDCIQAIGLRNFMFPAEIMSYLSGAELPVFIYICHIINKDDYCGDSYDVMADMTGLSGVSVRRALSKLEAIGLVEHIRGYHKTGRCINYENFIKLGDIISRHPGIGKYLRSVMGDKNISIIDSKEIVMANRMYNDEHGIENKTRKTISTTNNRPIADSATGSVDLFGEITIIE